MSNVVCDYTRNAKEDISSVPVLLSCFIVAHVVGYHHKHVHVYA